MAEPFNYNLQVANPMQGFMSGVQGGLALREIQDQRIAQQQQAEEQARMRQELEDLSKAPTVSGIRSFMIRNPALSEKFKPLLEGMSAEKKQAGINKANNVFLAAKAGKIDVVRSLLQQDIDAAKNSGEDSSGAETLLQTLDEDPNKVVAQTGLFLSQALGPDKFIETYGKLETLPADVRKGTAEATTAEAKAAKAQAQELAITEKLQADASAAKTESKYKEPSILLDLEKKGWDIKKIKSDIDVSKQQARIAAMNASIAREGNNLKRQELQLKVEEARNALADKIRTKVAAVENARGDMDNFLNTADRFLKLSIGKDGKPTSTLRAATGPLDSVLPTWQRDVADLEELANTLGSQAFMSQIPKMKGTGALSEKEGEKLQSSLQNLSLRQSPDQLLANVKEAQRLILKARKNLTLQSGVPESMPDTPAVAPSKKEVNDLVEKYTK